MTGGGGLERSEGTSPTGSIPLPLYSAVSWLVESCLPATWPQFLMPY
jgi:hypothetical protein